MKTTVCQLFDTSERWFHFPSHLLLLMFIIPGRCCNMSSVSLKVLGVTVPDVWLNAVDGEKEIPLPFMHLLDKLTLQTVFSYCKFCLWISKNPLNHCSCTSGFFLVPSLAATYYRQRLFCHLLMAWSGYSHVRVLFCVWSAACCCRRFCRGAAW